MVGEWIVGKDEDDNDDGVYVSKSDKDEEPEASTSAVTGSTLLLYEFGKRIRQNQNLSKAQRKRIVLETVRFIGGSETEQAQGLAGYLPRTGKEYIGMRLCSGAV